MPITRRLFAQLAAGALAAQAPERPNFVIFYLDDMGSIQPSCYGGKLAPTPHLDSIAANGVRFTNGYVAAPVCSPSRVGLVTGRYQARTGHDANTTARAGSELLLTETTIAQHLAAAGYTTAIIGKWHLGTGKGYLPIDRGFHHSMGSVSNLGESTPAFYRGAELLDTIPGAPITSPIYAQEACRFIDANRTKPFLLYLPFNAVHAPHSASPPYLEKFKHLAAPARNYAAQLAELDDSIGVVLKHLKDRRLHHNTLLFCISDNGGANVHSESGGLRGGKWDLNEAGIRVPFLAQWPARIRPGQVLHDPVIQLDVLPTLLAAANAKPAGSTTLDGVNLLPLLEGKAPLTREALFWRFGIQYAVRSGNWKLVKASLNESPRLINLAADPAEANDLAPQFPDKAKQLQALWDAWNAANRPPRWEDRRWGGNDVRRAQKKQRKKKK